jgi:hypothetical protein
VGHPAEEERGVRVAHGGGLGPLRGAPRPEEARGVCFEERPCQLLAEVREPLPPRPGGPGGGARLLDHEYERGGTANVHLAFEP